MSVTFNKPSGMKYTTMAIYIDQHIQDIIEPGKNPEIENKIFEYMYHIVYALSYKAMFFKNFEDYDKYSIYVASELYIAMRRRCKLQGTEVHGRKIKPIKSSLNYIKFVLFPFKVNYQNQTFASILNPESGQNTEELTEYIKESIQVSYREPLEKCFQSLMEEVPDTLQTILNETPYKKDLALIEKLRISCLLTLLSGITFNNKDRNRMNKKRQNKNSGDTKLHCLYLMYRGIEQEVLLWHLDESFTDYVLLLTRKLKNRLSKSLQEDIHHNDLSDNLIDSVMASAYANYDENVEGEE